MALGEIANFIRQNQEFLILSHVGPDGDTLGSGSALALALTQLGKKAVNAVDGRVPDRLDFLNDYTRFYQPDQLPERRWDCIIAVDTSDLGRLGAFASLFLAHDNTAVIDHHGTNTGYGRLNHVEDRGATGQIIWELLGELGVEIDKKIANALYTAISTDTGNFMFANTDKSILATASELVGCGAEVNWLMTRIYRQRTLAATRLLERALSRLEVCHDGQIAFLYVRLADYQETGAVKEDCDELVNYARDVIGVRLAIFFRETEANGIKVSFRGSEGVDVARLASHWQGGGHVLAAGCSYDGNLEEAMNNILAYAKTVL